MRLHTESLDIEVCQDFKSRLLGLRKYQPLGPRNAVLLSKCAFVHTIGMREPLSLFFLNHQFRITWHTPYAKPNNFYGVLGASCVIEMAYKTKEELERIRNEIILLRRHIDVVEYFHKGRIKTCVENTA